MKKIFLILSLMLLFVSCRKDTVFNGEGIYCDANGVGFYMVAVEGGTYYMGAQSNDPNGINYDEDAYSNESPVKSVTVNDFYIGEIEVTQKLWETVMDVKLDYYDVDFDGNNRPVYSVYYSECISFIEKLNELTGMEFRLPTEEEWEYAARGGNKSQGYKYSGSDKIGKVAWYSGNSEPWGEDGTYSIHPTKSKVPNELGIFDMSGNVNEYCESTSAYGYVSRGGDYSDVASCCRVTYRETYSNYYTTGLRLALSATE